MATVKDCAELSNAVYSGSTPDGWTQEAIEFINPSTGFQAALYYRKSSSEYVLAIAGTNGNDTSSNLAIIDGVKPAQFDNALNLYEEILEKYPDANISVTGHSLGGACAAYVASQYSVSATTFNAPGIGAIVGTSIRDNIQEFLTLGDVFAIGDHIGQESWYCPMDGLESLSAGNALKTHGIFEQWLGLRRYDGANIPIDNCKAEDDDYDDSPDDPFENGSGNPLDVPRNISPIILDLTKNGIQTSKVGEKTYFDHDANGFAENTGWVGGGDGLLVMDRDGNGLIDSGRELFGDQTILANGSRAINGFQALAEFDTNRDGKIDANDSAWSQLRVWVDNGNGDTDDGELKTLDELGIENMC